MRLDPKSSLFGQPILKIRAVIRQAMNNRLIDLTQDELDARLSKLLGTSHQIARVTLDQLIAGGYLECHKKPCGTTYLKQITATDKGRKLGIATANPAISRQKADELLKEIIEKATQINESKEFVYYVESIKVFGSYLSDKALLGDIDVAVKLSRRYEKDVFIQQNQKRIELAIQKGRSFANYIDELNWPYREVIMLLKSKRKGLSLHDEEIDGVVMKTETRTVYEFHL